MSEAARVRTSDGDEPAGGHGERNGAAEQNALQARQHRLHLRAPQTDVRSREGEHAEASPKKRALITPPRAPTAGPFASQARIRCSHIRGAARLKRGRLSGPRSCRGGGLWRGPSAASPRSARHTCRQSDYQRRTRNPSSSAVASAATDAWSEAAQAGSLGAGGVDCGCPSVRRNCFLGGAASALQGDDSERASPSPRTRPPRRAGGLPRTPSRGRRGRERRRRAPWPRRRPGETRREQRWWAVR